MIAFAKIHYAVITVAILLELLCRKDNKKWQHILLFSLFGIFFTCVFFALTQWMFPTYLSEWIPRILAMFLDNKTFDEASPVVLLNKLQRILKSVWPLLVILAVSVILATKNGRKIVVPQGLRFLVLNLVVNLLAFIYVGRHPGADLWYFYVMVIPSLVILGAYSLASLENLPFLYYAALVLCIPCWYNNLKPITTDAKQSGAYAAGFRDVYTTLDKYSSQEVYVSPVLGNYCIQHQVYNYNYGDTFYLVDDAFADRLYQISLAKRLLPYTKEIFAQHTTYIQKLEEKIENQQLSVIALDTVDSVPTIDNQHFYDLVGKYYAIAEQTTDLQIDHMKITISYWIPKEDE